MIDIDEKVFSRRDILRLVRNLVDFPYSQTCVYAAAFELINMDKSGMNKPGEKEFEPLIKSLVDGSKGDEDSIRFINKKLDAAK
jgi:hypothetical protein